MKHLVQHATGYVLDAYEDYLRDARPTLAARVHGDDLLHLDRNGLASRRSLHDARLLGLTVDAEGAVELVLRGAWHDRTFHLRYEGVRTCAVQLPRPNDDLLVHEVRAEGDGVVHELVFDHGRGIEVTCATLTFTERVG